ALPVFAQQPTYQIYPNYTASRDVTLSAAAEVVTIQAPGTSGAQSAKTLYLKSASITCAVSCDVTVERDGTAASTTALTINPLNRLDAASVASAFRSSNVGSGTVLSVVTVAAGTTARYDLSGKTLNAAENFTFRTSSVTGR